MDTSGIVSILQQALMTLFIVAAPPVLVAALVGLIVAILQATTQIQDQSISQSLKLGAVIVVLATSGSWMGSTIKQFGERLFHEFPAMVHKTNKTETK
jgi:type III secretion HrpO family protein